MRLSLAAAVLALGWAAAASADDNDWGSLAVVSTTMGVHASRLCVGEGSRGDLGCPADAPTVSGHTISGTFIGDGSGLAGVTASAADRITSGTTLMIANGNTDFISITTGGVDTGYFWPSGLLTINGVSISTAHGISSTNGYFGRKVGVGLANPGAPLHVSTTDMFLNAPIQTWSSGAGRTLDLGQPTGTDDAFRFRTQNAFQFMVDSFPALNIHHTGRIGVGTALPSVGLDISSTLRLANGGETCDADRAGAVRYTSASTFDFCDGTNGWRSLAAMATAGGVTTDRLVSGTSNVTVNEGGDISFSTAGTVRASLDTGGSLTVAGVVNANRIRESTTGMYLDYYGSSSRLGVFDPNGDAKVAIAIVGSSYGQILLDDAHSNAYPQYSFMSDRDTGMIGVSGTLRLVTNGAERFRVNESGQAAIGTTQPSDTLHVAGGNVMVSHASTGQYKWQYDPGQSIWSVGGGDYFTVKRGSTRLLNVDSSGRMGLAIGGLAASTTLHVNGTLRMADGGEACDTDRAGAMRYTSASTFDFCDGTNGWRSLAAMATAGGVTTDRLVSGSSVATLSPNGVLTVGGRLNVVTGTNVVAVGQSAAANANATNLTAVGVDAGKSFTGPKGLAVGYQAAENNSATDVTAVGYRAGRYNSSTTLTAVGAEAAMNSSGTAVTAVGGGAGANNTGHAATLVGGSAGRNNTASYLVATGYGAGTDNTGYAAVFSGLYAGNSNTGANLVGLGAWAAFQNTGNDLAAVGYQAARNNTGAQLTALGYQAGISNTYTNVTLLGNRVYTAGKNNQVILGNSAVVEVATSGTLLSAGVSATGGVTATYFSGDGSRLTGLPGGDRIVSGTTSVIASQDRSVTIATAGSTRMVVGENGRIGIGTALPATGLHISDTTVRIGGDGGFLHLYPDTGDSNFVKLALHATHTTGMSQYFTGIAYSSSGGSMSVGGGTSLNLNLDSGSSGNYGSHVFRKVGWDGSQRTFAEAMRIDRNGYVGISATAPKTMLHVRGAIRIGTDPSDTTNICDADRAGAMRYTSASTFDFCDGTNGWRTLAAMASAGGVTTDRIVSGTTSVIAAQDRSVTISTGGNVRVTVGENGSFNADAGGNSTHRIGRLTLTYGGNANPILSSDGNNVEFEDSIGLRGGAVFATSQNTSGLSLQAQRQGTPITFSVAPTAHATMVEAMRVAANGNVGISTTNPSQTLTVNGNGDFSGTVKVAGTGGEPCSPSQRGTLRQNPVTLKLEICRY